MSVIKFPTKLPSPEQLELPRANLVGLLQGLATRSLQRANDLMDAKNASEFAAVIRASAADTAAASAGWANLSRITTDSWGIKP